MFSAQYWYMGVISTLVIALEVFAAMALARHKWIARIVLWILAIFMLAYETQRSIRNHLMPIAFSTFTYYLFGLAALLPIRPLKSAAAFCCFLTGAIYLSGFVVYPDFLYARQPDEAGRLIGWFLHNVMLFGGLVLYGQYRVKKLDIIYVSIFVAFFVAVTEIAVHVYNTNAANTLFVGIIEATLIQQVAPEFPITVWWCFVWYVFVVGAFAGAYIGTYFLNRKLYPISPDEKAKLIVV